MKLFVRPLQEQSALVERTKYGVVVINPYLGKLWAITSRAFLERRDASETLAEDIARAEKWAIEQGFTLAPTWSPVWETDMELVWDDSQLKFILVPIEENR